MSRSGKFDRFATASSATVSRAPFFVACVLLIVVWVPTFLLFSIDTWQLIINTATTIVTFLLVALLQNSQARSDMATQDKLNAIADAVGDLMHKLEEQKDVSGLREDARELDNAVGLEHRETTS